MKVVIATIVLVGVAFTVGQSVAVTVPEPAACDFQALYGEAFAACREVGGFLSESSFAEGEPRRLECWRTHEAIRMPLAELSR